jgi:hypothetical protein
MSRHKLSNRRARGAMSPNCWLPLFMGMALAARADETRSEQEAFDRYFGMPAAARQTEWTTHFSIGAAVGFNISAKFNENGVFNLPSSSLANGFYDDGYVLTDITGSTDGNTTYWGYQKAGQVQNTPTGQSVVMHKTTSYTTTGNSSQDDGGPFPGFELDYGGNLYHWQNFRIGWDLGFDLVPLTISDNQTLTATVNQNAYTFNVPNGIIVPGPGYQGSYNGPGPLLSTSSTSSLSTPTGTVSGTRSLDTILYGIRLGPTFYWDFANNWSASLGVGPAMGIVSAEYKYNEVIKTTTSTAFNSGSFSGLDVVYGGDVNATLFYHTADKKRPVDLYISAQFMPLGSADFSQGGRDAKLDLSGQIYISAGVNWPF